MWWNDIKEIKDWMSTIAVRLAKLEIEISANRSQFNDICDLTDEFNPINRINDKLNEILMKDQLLEEVEICQKTLDKFDDYMKNVDKLNVMINEFKGCVSIARAAVAEKKEQQREFDELKDLSKITKEIYNSIQTFIDAGNQIEQKNYFKLDAIYRKICEIGEEKPKKKGNSRKKRPVNPSPLS